MNAKIAEHEDFQFGPYTVKAKRRALHAKNGDAIPLTRMELALIRTFAERPNQVLSREALMQIAHDREWDPYDRSVDVRVTRLRKKIETQPSMPRYIRTVRGIGYLYNPYGN